jgi:hypothetical protein
VVQRHAELRQLLRRRQQRLELGVVHRNAFEHEVCLGEERQRFEHRRPQQPLRVRLVGDQVADADQPAATHALQGCGTLGGIVERHPADDRADVVDSGGEVEIVLRLPEVVERLDENRAVDAARGERRP